MAIVQDLPIGVDPDGADAWAWQDLLAEGVSVGAPPDAFNTRGQDWGLPPFVPWRLRAAAYEPFVETIRATIAGGAGGLRVDHVMGLFRLWWVPAGGEPGDGAYVRYPADDLLDIVALESHRAGAVVVGEDLGTVEEAAREAMAERNLLSYRLLWFEEDDPATWPETAMAAVTTHDLPTVAGLWDGSDLAEQRRLGMAPNEEGTEAIRTRLAAAGGLASDAPADAAVRSAHRLLARAPCRLLTATLDDAIAEPERPNIPGADDGRPNWSLALPLPLEEVERHPLALEIAASLRDGVTTPTPEHPA
jgi:4-alpha-glucanotransferase